jgi:hypothetical protein
MRRRPRTRKRARDAAYPVKSVFAVL